MTDVRKAYDITIDSRVLELWLGQWAKERIELECFEADRKAFTSTLCKHELVKLSVQPGDILHVKLGDPAISWVPGPETEAEMLRVFSEAVEGRVPVVVTPYTANAFVRPASSLLEEIIR